VLPCGGDIPTAGDFFNVSSDNVKSWALPTIADKPKMRLKHKNLRIILRYFNE
jgi:hypothetical protein